MAGVHRCVIKNCRDLTPSCTGWLNEFVALSMELCSKSGERYVRVGYSSRKDVGRNTFAHSPGSHGWRSVLTSSKLRTVGNTKSN